jgi:hypothetical protein
MVDNIYQFWVLVGLIAGGFAWMVTWLRSIDHRLNDLETRVTVIETILSMMGAPVRLTQQKPKTDP